MNAGKKLVTTTEFVNAYVGVYKAGGGVREVAEALGVQEQTVRKRIDTLVRGGVELPPLVSRKKDIIAEAKAALAAALGNDEEVF